MSDIQNIVRDRIAQGYMNGNGATTPNDTNAPKSKPLPLFLDEAEATVSGKVIR
jgi:hypothetical protein